MRFTEEMTGWYTPGCPAYDAGFHTGRRDGCGLRFHLTISTPDVRRLLADPQHRMSADGWVEAKELGPARMSVHDATFDVFAPGQSAGRLIMRYELPFVSARGPMTLCGVKQVSDDAGLDLWRDTTTLFTRVLDAERSEHGRGLLRLNTRMFGRQLTTFRGRPAEVARFGTFFARSLARTYAQPFAGGEP